MKKNKAKAAAKVDALLAEAFTNDEARMQQIREQAHAELLRRTAEQPIKTKKKGLCYSVPALCALVIILIVAPIVAIIANPVGYSKANQLVRKATVWVNDTFKLDIELPVEDGGSELNKTSEAVTFTTVEEAAKYLEDNILVFDESSGCELKAIEIFNNSNVTFVSLKYTYNGYDIRLAMENGLDRVVESSMENSEEIYCPAGVLWMWSNNEMNRAMGYFNEWSVNIHIPCKVDDVQSLLQSIKWFN